VYLDHDRWILKDMKITSAATLILVNVLLPWGAAGEATGGCGSPRPLSRIVREFHARSLSVLEALFSLGRENEICFGVEDFDRQAFRRKVDFDVRNEPASEVIKRILAPDPASEEAAYEATEQDGVVLVQSLRPSRQTWLDYKLPVFKTRRGPLQEVNNILRMSLIWHTRPGLKGIAGKYPSGTATTQDGPFDEKNKTLRQLLNLIMINTQRGC